MPAPVTISIERSAEVGCELEGQGGLGVEPPGVQRAHETDEEMRVAKKDVSAGLQIAMATRVKTGAF